MSKDSEIIKSFYQRTIEEYPQGIKSYRWWSKTEQETRFKELLKIVDGLKQLKNRKLLDVGCGRGDLYQYLTKKISNIKYTGVDIIPEFIAAARTHYSKAEFIETEFNHWPTNQRFDYVVASGLVSTKVINNIRYLKRTVGKMWQLSKIGIAFNFLTIYRKDKLKHWFYYQPSRVLDWCLRLDNVKKVTLNIGYEKSEPLGDATIILLKNN